MSIVGSQRFLPFAAVVLGSWADAQAPYRQAADPVRHRVWHVDDDAVPGPAAGTRSDPFHTIQQGINAARDGNTVLVAPGVYNELINFQGKAIHVVTSEGPSQTFIQEVNSSTPAGVRFESQEGPDSILEGFTIRDSDNIRCNGAAPTIVRNVIAGNAFGIICANAAGVRILSNVIRSNFTGWTGTGGIYASDSDLLISGNVVLSHYIDGISPVGAGIGLFRCTAILESNIIANNTLGHTFYTNRGGGLYAEDSVVSLVQNTFTRNEAAHAWLPGQGGAIACVRSELRISSTISWGDFAEEGSEIFAADSFVRVDHSNVEGGAARVFLQGTANLVWGDGNVDMNPHFRDASSADYRLTGASPMIDRGAAFLTPGGTDAFGDPRILDGDQNGVQRADIGADEYDAVELLAAGTSVLGGTLTLTTLAPPGYTYELFVATEPGDTALPPFGSMLVGSAGLQTVGSGAVPGADMLSIPFALALVGSELWAQSLALEAPGGPGSFSNVLRFTVH